MDNKQIEAFYKEIGQVCQKHKIGAFVGWWFASKGHEQHGTMKCWDITDEQMKALATFMENLIIQWKSQVANSPEIGRIRTVITSKSQGS